MHENSLDSSEVEEAERRLDDALRQQCVIETSRRGTSDGGEATFAWSLFESEWKSNSGIPRHQRDVVPSTQVRVVRKTLFAPGEGRQLLFSDGHVGDNWLPYDVYEGSPHFR